jgi:outer membrane protein
MTMIKGLLSSLFLLLAFFSYGQQKYELTVKEAVDLAFKNVIEIKNAEVDYRIQELVNKEIAGRALPQVSGSVGLQHYIKVPQLLFPQSSAGIYQVLKDENLIPQNTAVPAPTLAPFSFQQPWNGSAGATVTQLLFQPDVFVGLQARKTALEVSNAMIEQSKQHIRDSAYTRYYAVLIAEKQIGFIDSGIRRLEKLYHDDSLMYKNGFAEKLDLDKVQVQLNNLYTTRSVISNGISMSYAALKFALGLSQSDTVQLKEELTSATLKEGILDNNFNYQDRSEIKTLEATKKLQALDVKRNQLGVLPTVALAGNYTANAMGQKFFTDQNTRWFSSSYIGLNVAVPIFDGFQRRSRMEQARLKVTKLDNTITNVKQVIDLQQTITKTSLTSALINLDIQERNQQLAERVYATTKKKFEQGLGSSFEVLQADADFQLAQSNYFNALYNATVARIGYLSSLGKLQ